VVAGRRRPAGGDRAGSPRPAASAAAADRPKPRHPTPAPRAAPPRSLVLPLASLALLVAAVYFPAVDHGFVHWDDEIYVFENPHVLTGLTPGNIAWAFTRMHESTWQPVTWLSYMVDATLFGTGPRGFHTVNLVLHALAAMLLFVTLLRLTEERSRARRSVPGNAGTASAGAGASGGGAGERAAESRVAPCLLAAALFAVHPLNVEPVAWVASRKDLLAAIFWFLTILAYARWVERPSAGRTWAVVALFACGLMSKPVLMTLPVILLLLDFWPLRRTDPWRRRILEKIPLFALSAASLLLTFIAQKAGGAIGPLDEIPIGERLSNALLSYVLYLRDAVWPTRLAAFYPREPIPIAAALGAGALLAGVTLFVVRLRSRRPHLLTGWLWYAIALLPMSGLVQFGSHARADRFTYLPLVGLYFAVSWSVRRLFDHRTARAAVVAAAIAVVLLLAGLAHRQARFWRDDATLFGHALAVTKDNYLAHTKLGAALAYAKRPEEAYAHFVEVVRLRPRNLDGWFNLGAGLDALGRRAESIEAYEKGLSLSPGDDRLRRGLARSWNNRGVDAATAGQMDEARRCFEEALRADPENANARGNLNRAGGGARPTPASRR
jgi:tetratricopeptide (TPR) repeat protein